MSLLSSSIDSVRCLADEEADHNMLQGRCSCNSDRTKSSEFSWSASRCDRSCSKNALFLASPLRTTLTLRSDDSSTLRNRTPMYCSCIVPLIVHIASCF
ncbi:unnamed protein product [Xylocopa violacea]|uniref:Uncharacterized protein n=1 Tax=Xylocopa violacea TaxID=135666 RepID=A0ABP1P3V7_XYLVO